MGSKLVLLGGGGHCKSVIDVLKRINTFESIVITDPIIKAGSEILGIKVIGTDECLESLHEDGFEYAFIAVGNIGINPVREKLSTLAYSFGLKFPIIIDPSATVSDSANIEEGTFVGKNAVVNADSWIGKNCIINSGAIVEHECVIGDYSHISVGSILCGDVNVGRNTFIGAGSTVIQGRKIGRNVVIGANSTVLSDVEDNMKCYGIVNKCVGETVQEHEAKLEKCKV